MPAAADWEIGPAVVQELIPGTDRAISLRHPAYPYVVDLGSSGSPDDLLKAASGYLRKVATRFGLPVEIVKPDEGRFTSQGTQLTWLPVAQAVHGPERQRASRRSSFWVSRYEGEPSPRTLRDLNVVLLAVPSLKPNDSKLAMGSGLGIRINARLVPRPGSAAMGITSSTCSAELADMVNKAEFRLAQELLDFFTNDTDKGFRAVAKARIALAAAFPESRAIALEGFRVLEASAKSTTVEMRANFSRPLPPDDGVSYTPQRPADGVAYAVTIRAFVESDGRKSTIQIDSIRKDPLVAHAVQHKLLLQDPPSLVGPSALSEGRANRGAQRLKDYLENATLKGINQSAGVVDLDDNAEVLVTQSKLLNRNADETAKESVRLNQAVDARTNPFAALGAYMHVRGLFERMRSYGFDPDKYFRYAAPKVRVRYRAPIIPGPGKDGRTVNAQVDYDPPQDEFGVPRDQDAKPLQVRFALADLKRSWSRREPLGVSADPRWCWHEFGHLLLAASTGGLELPFAHSVGDALAAIACDPASKLAPKPSLRGLTYPWVALGRRHDRQVGLGWSWSGIYHRPDRIPDYTDNRLRKGYHSEQVLSSSLFRLYLSLGGDTLRGQQGLKIRQAASDYVLYLIMKAIEMLPPASAGSAQTPGQFVDLLMEADTSTLPVNSGPLADRVGGWAHKVIRWAFEAQGLYAPVASSAVYDHPGDPPPVDIFIDDQRPDAEGKHPRGGYMPVPLDWEAAPGQPSWRADPNAVQIDAAGNVKVEVWNRGGSAADSVTTAVWYKKAPLANPPDWKAGAWTALATNNGGPLNLGAAGSGTESYVFGPFTGLPITKGTYFVLAATTCAGDRSNIDPDSDLALPTADAANKVPLIDLVTGDNNIGLVVHEVP